MLLAMGLLRFGFLANFLSHPVVSGFITASGLVIGLSQLRHILGIDASGDNLLALGSSLLANLGDTNFTTLVTGIGAILFLAWARQGLQPLLQQLGLPATMATILAKAGPVLVILVTVAASYLLNFGQRDVALVGEVPRGLPSLALPRLILSSGVNCLSRRCLYPSSVL